MFRAENLENEGVTRLARAAAVAGAAGGSLLTLLACGPQPQAPDADGAQDVTPAAVYAGDGWPEPIEQTTACPTWSPDNPSNFRRIVEDSEGKKHLFVLTDARLSAPRECNPDKDIGAGPQQGASVQSGRVDMPSDETVYKEGGRFNNGIFVEVVAFTHNGEQTCQTSGSADTQTWVRVAAKSSHPLAWVAISLTGYEPKISDLKELGIPQSSLQPALYGDMIQGGCEPALPDPTTD